jgi:hypothetical protein
LPLQLSGVGVGLGEGLGVGAGLGVGVGLGSGVGVESVVDARVLAIRTLAAPCCRLEEEKA